MFEVYDAIIAILVILDRSSMPDLLASAMWRLCGCPGCERPIRGSCIITGI